MGIPLRVLILEDHPADAELIVHELREAGFELEWWCVDNEADYLAHLDPALDVILADYSLPQWDAPHALRRLQERGLDIPFIMISGTVGEDIAVECIQQGAADYLLKDRLARLGPAVVKALADRQLRAERQQAEEEIKRLKEFNENTVQTMAEGIMVQNAEGTFTFVNPAAADMLGCTTEELIGLPWTTVVPPEYHPIVRAADERRKRGEADRYEIDVIRKDGTRRSILLSGSPRFEDGRFVGTLAVITDITERKQAEAALRKSEERQRTVLENMPVLLDALDDDLNLIAWNRECERVTGYSADEIIRHPNVAELLYPDPRYRELMHNKLVASGDYRDWEWETTCKDGSVRTIAWSNISQQYPVPGWAKWGIGIDITERKRVEEVLRRHDAILQALASISEQLLRSTDLDAVLPEALAQLGQAAGASRAHIFENHVAPDGTLFTTNRYEWVAPHQVSYVETLSLQNVAYAEGFERWADVLSKGQPLYGLVREHPESERAILQAQNILSQATVPIFAGEEWWGFLGFDDCDHEREWLPAEIEALRNVANALGAALLRQRAESAEQEQRTLAEALRDTAAILTSTLDLQVVMNRILENVGRVVPHDAANIMLIEGHTARVAARHGYNTPTEASLDEQGLTLDIPHLRDMFVSGLPCLIADTDLVPSWVRRSRTAWIRSYAATPIWSHGQVIGFLNLDSGTPGFFTPDHITRLKAFADQAAIAIENAQLYDEIQRHAAELEQRVIERTAELNHTTERVEAILNSSSDIIFLLSNDGTIQQANPAFGQVFNCEPETVLGQPLTILTEPDAAQTLLGALRATVEGRQPQRVEIPVRYKDSAVFDADMALSPTVERDHQTRGVVCSLRDITKRKELETRLRQTLEKEVELNQLKTRFVSMVSHEFRTPLAVIQTASELMLQYSDRMTEEQKRRELDHILSGVTQMVELLDDVLVISRTEAGKLEFSPEPLDLRALCQGILADLRQTTGGSHLLVFSVTGECTDVVMDSKLLHHVIGNLLSNAIKYSPASSTVSFDLTCQRDQATMVIRDEGIGIPKADQAHLFETFHRAANVRTIRGTGLGLTIVKQAVQLHGGTITLESVEGAGTTVVVTIPNASAGEH